MPKRKATRKAMTAKAQGLMPSSSPATRTVGSSIGPVIQDALPAGNMPPFPRASRSGVLIGTLVIRCLKSQIS